MKLLRSTDIGYSPLSARDRQIKDGSKYDALFPKPENKTTLLQRNGEVEDTVKKMQQIVVDYSWQVRELCKKLKAPTVRQSVKNVFDFVYNYIKYQVEDGEKLRTPAYSWYEGQILKRQNPTDEKIGVDCDCMSIFCGSCFREMKIPFAFRVTGYADRLGLCHGYQHVYAIAYDPNGKEIICDPVYIAFDKEKEYAIQKTYPMSLNGTDIVMLSGLSDDESHHEYVENPDGTIGELNGRKKRKARKAKRKEKKAKRKAARKEKRAAKKEKKAAKKAIRKAKKSGDKEALKAAKERKRAAKDKIKAAKETIRENRTGIAKVATKIGQGIKRFTVATTMQVPRTMFCLLLRLNFRGLAKKLATNEKVRERFHKLWRNLGGKTKSWQKAVEKGKNKKPLFGSKKLKGFTELQLQQLGAVLDEWNVLDGATLGDIFSEKTIGELGVEPTTTAGAAIATATPIIVKVVKMLKEMGESLPETAEENGGEGEELDENTSYNTEEEQAEEAEQPEENYQAETPAEEYTTAPPEDSNVIDVEYQEVDDIELEPSNDIELSEEGEDGADGEEVESYEVDEMEGLGSTLGAGLFKKLANGIKKVVSKRKEKRAAKKAAKSDKKAQKTAKRKARKVAKSTKKNNKKDSKTTTQKTSKPKSKKTTSGKQKGSFVDKIINNEATQNLVDKATDTAMSQGAEMLDKVAKKPTTKAPDLPAKPGSADNEKKSFFAEHPALSIVGGLLLATGVGVGIYKVASKPKGDKLQSLELF